MLSPRSESAPSADHQGAQCGASDPATAQVLSAKRLHLLKRFCAFPRDWLSAEDPAKLKVVSFPSFLTRPADTRRTASWIRQGGLFSGLAVQKCWTCALLWLCKMQGKFKKKLASSHFFRQLIEAHPVGRPCTLRSCKTQAYTLLVLWQYSQIS